MPAFTAVGAYVAGTLLGLAGTAALVVGAVVATGAAYVTSRIINGNQNKGNNSAATQGGRIQVPPATNNKIPVVYGSAYVNGIITDARLKSIGGTNNDTMYYCLVLSEYTNNLTTTPSYGLESVIWNDLRLTPVDATTNAHKVKDGRKVVDGAIVAPGSFVVGTTYVITKRGNTNFIALGAQTNNIGQIFTATSAGTGGETGRAQEEDFINTDFIVDNNSLVELRVYAGGSAATDQIYPPQSTGNTTPAYTFWGNNDSSWGSAYQMSGLVFAIVKMTYATNGFTSLPNVTFQLANNVANPADVWYDYMTSVRYGAGIPAADIDSTARTAWYNYCAEDINYTSANLDPAGGTGTADQITERYQINGILDTSNQVKTNIDTILQNGGAWMSYNVATGLWSPVIKKAVTAGIPGDATTYFTASRTGTTLTVTAFPNGRIEAGQELYNSSGTLIGTISAQLAPTAGETAGQIGRYTTSTSGVITTTTFYTIAPSLLSFSDDNIISGINISSTRLEDLYNRVEVEFYDKYNKDQKAYYRTTVPNLQLNPNEPVNALRMSLDLCNNSIQSDLLGQIELRQSRDDLVIEFTSNHYGIQAQAGDVINVTSDLYGWAPKPFRVMRVKEQETEEGGLVAQIQALEYNPDAYTIESISEFSTAANIGIGNLISSVGLPPPQTPVITNTNPTASVPNFTFSVDIPATGGPFDEIEIYYTEGWDPNSVTGWIDNNSTPGTYSGVAGTIMTVTSVTYNSINVGDYFDLGGVTVVNQLTQTTIPTKTFVSGGAVGAFTFVINDNTGSVVVIGQKPTGTGIPSGAMVVGVSGTTVTLDKAFTVQATGNYDFTTAGGTGTYTVNISTAANGTDDLFDQPLDTDFIFLKNKLPDGNATAFTSPSTVSILIVELPANSQTFRRYFLKSRLGNKKNFGRFSPNVPIDLDGNVSWNPNPSANGGPGIFGDIEIAVESPTTISVTGDNNFITISQTSTSTNVPQNGLRISVESTGTPAAGFGTNLEFEIETAPGVKKQSGLIECALTDVSSGSEDAKLEFTLMTAGSETPSVSPQLVLENNGNLTTVGQFISTKANSATTGGGQIYLNGATGNRIDFNVNGLAAPATTTRSVGTKMVLYPSLSASLVDYAIGTNSNTIWFSLDANNSGKSFQWYGGTTEIANLNGVGDLQIDGDLTVTGNDIKSSSATAITLSGSNVVVAGDLTVTGGDIITPATTFNIKSSSTATHTLNLGCDAFASSAVKTINIGNGGDATNTTNITLGDTDGLGGIYAYNALLLYKNLVFQGSTSGSITLSAGTTPANQTYTLPQAYPAVNNYSLRSTTGGTLSWALTGDVSGPASATDNAIARFNLTTGKIIQDSGVIIDDSNNVTGVVDLTASGNVTATTSYVTGTLSTRVVATATTTSTSQFTLTSSGTRNVLKCLINIVQGTNVHCCEAIVLRVDATTATIAVYGEMFNTSKLADFDADVSSGTLRLRVTPTSATSTIFTVLRDSLD